MRRNFLSAKLAHIAKRFEVDNPEGSRAHVLTGIQAYRVKEHFESLVNLFGNLLVKAKIIKHKWELRRWLGLPPASPMDAIKRKCGVNGLRKAYRENLTIVLEHVAKLCNELLGENGKYSHGIRTLYTSEVPWPRVKTVKRKIRDEDIRLSTRFTALHQLQKAIKRN